MDTICSTITFKNPDKLPLNKLLLEYKEAVQVSRNEETLEEIVKMLSQRTPTGYVSQYYKFNDTRKPALDKCWIEKKSYHKFEPYLLHLNEKDNRNFLKNEVYLHQLQFLANCTYQQFWCYISYDANVTLMINDFLYNALPVCTIRHLSKKYFDLYNQIHACILCIMQRLMDFDVSEIEHLEESTVRNILLRKDLLNVETIFLLSYLYNASNQNLLKRIVKFSLSSKNNFVKEADVVLSKIGSKLEHFLYSTTKLSPEALEEMAFFLFEMSWGLNNFLSTCDAVVDVAFSLDLPFGIMCVYQKVYSEIDNLLEKRCNGGDFDLLKQWVAYGKFEFINAVHIFTASCINEIASSKDNREKQENAVEIYISLISNALDNELFIISYNETYSIREQFQILVDCVSNFDSQQTEYLLQSLDSIIKSVPDNPAPSTLPTSSKEVDSERNYVEECEQIYVTLSQFLERSHNKKVTNLPRSVSLAVEQYYDLIKDLGIMDKTDSNDNAMNRNAQAVLDVLPHLSYELVTQCLEKYNGDPTEVIAHILNGDFPTDLKDVPDVTSTYSTVQRIGKKWNDLNASNVLDDKKEKEKIKELVLKASYTFVLDDEYDDRVEIGHSLNDSDNESRILRHLGEAGEDSEESESEEESQEEKRNNSRDFCVDPAILREKRAHQHQSPRVFRQNKHSVQTNEKTASKNTKPKHNRRKGATWKRNKGMIPS